MQQPIIQEAETKSPPPVQFTVKPSGEFSYTGKPDQTVIEQLLVSSDYQRDRNRQLQSQIQAQINNEARIINILTIGFLGTSFLVAIVCAYLTANNPNSNRSMENNGGIIRRACPQ
jgi:hypothetical protein